MLKKMLRGASLILALFIAAKGVQAAEYITDPEILKQWVEEDYEDGITAYQAGDYGKAVRLLESFAKYPEHSKDPRNTADLKQLIDELYAFVFHSSGIGYKNPREHTDLIRRLAFRTKNPKVEFAVAELYYDGRLVSQDYVKAVKWLRKAAGQGMAEAQHNLGVAYANGTGVRRSEYVAADWFFRAGQSYLREKNRDEALQAVEAIEGVSPGHPLAARLLAEIYAQPIEPGKEASTEVSLGTGWPTAWGYVVTNHHVVDGYDTITLMRADAVRLQATVVMHDRANDLALLQVSKPDKLPPALPLASPGSRVGARVFTIGYPHPDVMGARPKLTNGVISAITGLQDDPRTYQITAPLQAGNSGGPLLNMKGEVIGVITSKLSAVEIFRWTGDLPQNVNYAVKVQYLKTLLSSVTRRDNRVRELPQTPAGLEELAARIQGSVMMVIAE